MKGASLFMKYATLFDNQLAPSIIQESPEHADRAPDIHPTARDLQCHLRIYSNR